MAVKQWLGSAARAIRDRVRAHSRFDLRTVRGREHWRAGIELLWHPFDARTERTAISHVDSFGEPVLFLVRDQRDYIQSHFLTGHFYAEDELRLIGQYYRGGAFLDVGANVGNHALFAARILKAPRVIAVEPNREAAQILRCNIILNELEDIVEHQPVAFSDHDGAGSIESMPGNLGLAVLTEPGGDVVLTRGDDCLAGEEVGFVKIDVEGHEMAVLRGLEATLRRFIPPLLVEVDDLNAAAFEQFLRDMRYRTVASFRPYRTNSYVLALPEPDA